MTNKNYFDPFSFGKQAVGFDTLFERLREVQEYAAKAPNYPPFNIKKVDENRYVIELAVAGFGKQNLDIELSECLMKRSQRRLIFSIRLALVKPQSSYSPKEQKLGLTQCQAKRHLNNTSAMGRDHNPDPNIMELT